MLRIAVCDDNKDLLSRIVTDINEFKAARGSSFAISTRVFENGSDLIDSLKRNEKFDIILLDILMPFTNGIEVAKELRLIDKVVKIIFLTSSPQFAIESYDVKAFSYILKSSSREKLFTALSQAVLEIEDITGKYTMLKTKTGLVKFFFHSIEYMEIIGRTITIYLSNGEHYEVFGTLTEIEELFLSRKSFIKPHRSYIVNMDYIRRLDKNEIETLNGYRISVSKALYTEVKKCYMDYSFSRGIEND